ncbi:glycosyltransferase [Silvibacterium sp.]|uniref:glycosyltransferase n=1 Tax=Silvibacterium sp. TaxID=1964179 RepID=UPI0039E3AB79
MKEVPYASSNPWPPSAASSLPAQRVSILAVVVLYQIAAKESISLQSLLHSRAEAADPNLEVHILLVDNSPDAQVSDENWISGIEQLVDPKNQGLANAYNRAIEIAEDAGSTWLLTLDQDTALPPNFLSEMAKHARQHQQDPSIAAILPRVQSGSTAISPLHYRWGALPAWYPSNFVGVPDEPVFGINSASLLRVDALVQARGYDPWFWLDCSDTAIFRRLHKFGKRVSIAGDVEVQHELSVKNMQHQLSPERYRHMLLADSAFWDAEGNLLKGFELTGRLLMRLMRQFLRREPSTLRHLTVQALLRRLFLSRGYRIRLFRETVHQHLAGGLSTTALSPRHPKVSVCMASYNAGHYIDMQLQSILLQLDTNDEIVIIDDNSTDGTPDRIRTFADPRIRLIVHTRNAGVIRTFEQALRTATGDILFLSDHDDIWAPDKVQLFREAFGQGPHVQLVMSAISLIDAEGIPFRNRRWDKDGKFQRGFLRNIVKNNYQGSSLALRSNLLAPLLPFPTDRKYLHDAWIGTLNDRLHGGMVFLQKPLLLYRRHATNVSQNLTLKERILGRTQLLMDHLWHAIRCRPLLRKTSSGSSSLGL